MNHDHELNQRLFTISANHLLAQNSKSQCEDGDCDYRSDDGKMCGIGPLISDEVYDRYVLEGMSVEDEGVMDAIAASQNEEIGSFDWDMLGRVQLIHDAQNVEGWRTALERLAQDKGYDWTPPRKAA